MNTRVGSGSGIDNDGHGTHVAGIIGASGNNATRVTGVCWNGSVMSVKFMGRLGIGSGSDAAEGIRYAVQHGREHHQRVVRIVENSATVHDAVKYAKQKGALIVVAAGNEATELDRSPVYPAELHRRQHPQRRGDRPERRARVVLQLRRRRRRRRGARFRDPFHLIGGEYAVISGTSMAAPLVAGIVGLLKAKNSDAKFSDWKTAVRRKVDKPASVRDKVVYDGRANLHKAIKYIATVD